MDLSCSIRNVREPGPFLHPAIYDFSTTTIIKSTIHDTYAFMSSSSAYMGLCKEIHVFSTVSAVEKACSSTLCFALQGFLETTESVVLGVCYVW